MKERVLVFLYTATAMVTVVWVWAGIIPLVLWLMYAVYFAFTNPLFTIMDQTHMPFWVAVGAVWGLITWALLKVGELIEASLRKLTQQGLK
jgi:signal transduction histidine kinase